MSDRRRLTRSQNDVPGTVSEATKQEQRELRRQILEIQNNPALSMTEKAQRTQAIMYKKNTSPSPINLTSSMSSLNIPESEVCVKVKIENEEVRIRKVDFKVTWHDAEKKIMGCKHYHRGNKLQAECCKKWFTCRLCHDDEEDHKIDRYTTKNMLCMRCNTVQRASQTCISCKTDVAKYFCGKCKLWSDDPDKSIYHCDGCGVCRVGKGIGIDYFHCDKCCACLSVVMKDEHKCIEQRLKCDCPICFDFMFDSTKEVVIMPCGHAIHKKCYKKHTETAYQCPVCLKSLGDMQERWVEINDQIAISTMPEMYRNHRSNIFCNDCEKKSETKYHWIGHKCQHCGGYNTTVLKVLVSENIETESVIGNEISSTPSSLSSSTTLTGSTLSPSSSPENEDTDSEGLTASRVIDTLFDRYIWSNDTENIDCEDDDDEEEGLENEGHGEEDLEARLCSNVDEEDTDDEKDKEEETTNQKEKSNEMEFTMEEGNEKKRRKERDDDENDTLPSSRFKIL